MRFLGRVVAVLMLATPAHAQTANGQPSQITDAMADAMLSEAIANITLMRDSRGRALPPVPATAPTPLLDRALVKEVAIVGLYSRLGELCGLDWANDNYLKLMRRERARGDRSDHQLAAIAYIHGSAGQRLEIGASQENCARTVKFYADTWGRHG